MIELQQNKAKNGTYCIYGMYWRSGFMQDCGNSIAEALELPQSCTMPWTCLHCCTLLHKLTRTGSGPWFNIRMSSYQYRKSHCGDKTVIRLSYLHNGISYTDKMICFNWIRAQDLISRLLQINEITLILFDRFLVTHLWWNLAVARSGVILIVALIWL